MITSCPPSTPIIIHVKLSAKKLSVTKCSKVIAVYPIAIGSIETPTPKGIYTILDKVEKPNYQRADGSTVYGPLGTRWLGFKDLSDGSSVGLHGTNKPDSIGKAVTGSCIRLNNANVEVLFSKVKIGTKVVITD